jgi:hypothetical protein
VKQSFIPKKNRSKHVLVHNFGVSKHEKYKSPKTLQYQIEINNKLLQNFARSKQNKQNKSKAG